MRDFLRTTLLACVLSFYPIAPGLAGPLEDGLAAYNRGDYTTALRLWRPLAEQGDAAGQAYLGAMYANGKGIAQDYAEAVTLYRKAAEQGHVVAQHQLGLMYSQGIGVPQDYAEAATWYRKAAEQGDAGGQFFLGLLYTRGEGVPQNYVEAYKWYSLAAASGDKDSARNRNDTKGKMTPAQIAEAERLAQEWKPKQ